MRKLFASVLLAGFAATTIPAAALDRTVPPNTTSMIDFVGSFDTRTCQNGPKPRVRIADPKHGRVTMEWTSRKVDASLLRAGNRKCVGTTMRGMAIYYTPNSGYTGRDKVGIRYRYGPAGYHSRSAGKTIRIRVQ